MLRLNDDGSTLRELSKGSVNLVWGVGRGPGVPRDTRPGTSGEVRVRGTGNVIQ